MVATLLQQQQQQEEEEEEEEEEEGGGGGGGISINDNVDLLAEILGRLDARSLAVAARVCRLWAGVARRDALWESLCLRRVSAPSPSPATRSVVAALGGYRRLYQLCLGPALVRLDQRRRRRRSGLNRWAVEPQRIHLDRAQAHAHARAQLSVSLSLFSIDCYERLGLARQGPASLLFLCKPVDLA